MRVDHDVDVLGSNSARIKILEQLGGLAVDLAHLVRQLVANASLDQDVLFSGANQQRIQPGRNEIPFIGGGLFGPHDFGNDAEERAAVEGIGAIGEDAEFEVAEIELVHGSC